MSRATKKKLQKSRERFGVGLNAPFSEARVKTLDRGIDWADFLPVNEENKPMKVWQLVQILCRLDPDTEVLLSYDGFPPINKVPLERVYNDDDYRHPAFPKNALSSLRPEMDMQKRKPKSVEQLYPSPKGRAAADAAVDALDPSTTTLSQALDVWDQTYFDVTGYSPFRKPKESQ